MNDQLTRIGGDSLSESENGAEAVAPIYSGKRAANAGDEYHELWALRAVLRLLDPTSRLQIVTVEGIAAGVGTRVSPEAPAWDGVDCALYYGESADSIDRIDVVQVKYSGANPSKRWTAGRLVESRKTLSRNSSVIARLAEAYEACLSSNGAPVPIVRLRLVSNQPLGERVVKALVADNASGPQARADRENIARASSLEGTVLAGFLAALDFTECGGPSRFELETRVIREIATWGNQRALNVTERLRRFIRSRMLPESHGERMTLETLVAELGYGDSRALFPAPSRIESPRRLLYRRAVDDLAARLVDGARRVCLHGRGGEGKTMVVRQLESALPTGSISVVYDCYGLGTYLDSDGHRHRPRDGFPQLVNEAATRLRLPLLLPVADNTDWARQFVHCIERASEVLRAIGDDALLVLVVDAADNAILAAANACPPEASFVDVLLDLGELPANVRMVVSCRTGRRERLRLDRRRIEVVSLPIEPFTREESGHHATSIVGTVSERWIDDFHELSGGNGRVQRYALGELGTDPALALSRLQPGGVDLDALFDRLFREARERNGMSEETARLCAALIALPRPVPIARAAEIAELDPELVHDLALDLAPALVLDKESSHLRFADEDFEDHVRKAAEPVLEAIRRRATDVLLGRAASDGYACRHAAYLAALTGRHESLLELAEIDPATYPMASRIERDAVHRLRLAHAMRAARTDGDDATAVALLLRGAEAMKTDRAIDEALVEFPDLAARFARDRVERTVLAEPDRQPAHGSLLMHLSNVDAERRAFANSRAHRRQLNAWSSARRDRRRRDGADPRALVPDEWSNTDRDRAAVFEAIGMDEGFALLARRIRRTLRDESGDLAFGAVVLRLCMRGQLSEAETLLDGVPPLQPGWRVTRVALALAGQQLDVTALLSDVRGTLERHPPQLERLDSYGRGAHYERSYVSLLLTALEVAAFRGGERSAIVELLGAIAEGGTRHAGSRYVSSAGRVDAAFRAWTLQMALSGENGSVEDFLAGADEERGPDGESRARDRRRDEDTRNVLEGLLRIYAIRNDILLGRADIAGGIESLLVESRRLEADRRGWHATRQADPHDRYAADALLSLGLVPDVDGGRLFEAASALFGRSALPYAREAAGFLGRAGLVPALAPEVRDTLLTAAETLKAAEHDEATWMLRRLLVFSRVALPLDVEIARSIFEDALGLAAGVDLDSLHELVIVADLARAARPAISPKRRRELAVRLFAVSINAVRRLKNEREFPWEELACALASLDPCVALAVDARIREAEGVVAYEAEDFLRAVVTSAVDQDLMTAARGTALAPFAGDDAGRLAESLVKRLDDTSDPATVASLARDMTLGSNRDSDATRRLARHPALVIGGRWSRALARRAVTSPGSGMPKLDVTQGLRSPWRGLSSASQLRESLAALEADEPPGTRLEEALDCWLDDLPSIRRVAGLRLLVTLFDDNEPELEYFHPHDLLRLLVERLDRWVNDDGVRQWCESELLDVLAAHVAGLSHYLVIGDDRVERLVRHAASGDARQRIATVLLDGAIPKANEMNAVTLVRALGVTSGYLPPADALSVLEGHLGRLYGRLPTRRDEPTLADLPESDLDGLARYIYARLGNPRASERWSAARAVRRLASAGDTEAVSALRNLYGRANDHLYDHPSAPFYALHARLWLMIAFARVASETPHALLAHREWLFEVAESSELPHVLIRSFAARTLVALASSGRWAIPENERTRLDALNRSSLAPTEPVRERWTRVYDRYHPPVTETRRFRFDTYFTLPNWYEEAVTLFSDVDGETFLDAAECWIVEHWEVEGDPPEIDKRRGDEYFLGERGEASYHDGGRPPSIDRYRSYLEWHAMFCSVGELLVSRPLAHPDPDDPWSGYAAWLSRAGLTFPPFWMSDLRGPLPPDRVVWPSLKGSRAVDVGKLPLTIEQALGLDGERWIALAYYQSATDPEATVITESCLVSEGDISRVRTSYECQESSFDYRLPVGKRRERVEGCTLTAILEDTDSEPRLDLHDRGRGAVGHPSMGPTPSLVAALELARDADGSWSWLDEGGAVGLVWEAWSESASAAARATAGESPPNGYRLMLRRDLLERFLENASSHLLIGVNLRRRPARAPVGEGPLPENDCHRIVVLRRDGQIEAREPLSGGRWFPFP